MNALREIVTKKNGRVSMRIPKEYAQQRFEIIVIPIEDSPKDSLALLMDKIGYEAQKQGLTPEILNDLLIQE